MQRPDPTRLIDAVSALRQAVETTQLPLPLEQVGAQRAARTDLLHQLDDYVLPRLNSLDAPMLCVVGGSTGAGKSTLVNSVVGEQVTRAGVLRPTTRASVLVHHPDDARWFTDLRILPGLARVTGPSQEENPGQLRLVASTHLPRGVALLDAPDIDSVVEANRDLARQLLSAADLWLFVTTAARYADAVPWSLLQQATDRGTSVAVVLNRVPVDAMTEVRSDLARMLMEQGLGQSPVFTVLESTLGPGGSLPMSEVGRVRSWLSSLAADSRAASIVIRRTLDGALASLDPRTEALALAAGEQVAGAQGLRDIAGDQYGVAYESVVDGMSDGSLLRGEVLARWQEFVGTGEWMRQFDAGVSRLRDRVAGVLRGRGRSEPAVDLGEALHSGIADLIRGQAESAAIATARTWRRQPGGATLLEQDATLSAMSDGLDPRIERLVRDWQGEVLELVRAEAGGRRATARAVSFGINGIGVMLMLLAFSATGGMLAGAEVGVAGGSAIVAQRVLEAIFGDQAVRSLAAKAKDLLAARVKDMFDSERARYLEAVDGLGVQQEAPERVRAAIAEVRSAR
ncbi:ABC transporter [Dermacoccaceae bacterium W4C1]